MLSLDTIISRVLLSLIIQEENSLTDFKRSYARLARLLGKSREKWKNKAIERHKTIRTLKVKVRDLEKSRAQWKARALNQKETELSTVTSESTEDIVTVEDDERSAPHNHQYSLLIIRLALELQLMHISLRGTCHVLELFNWALLEGSPTFPTVQNWACRYGLYILNQAKEYRTDWVFVLDHTVARGKNKCLVILGISEENLERVNYCPSHKDMQVLHLEVTDLGTGEALSASLECLGKQVGIPTQIVADHGSDVVKGIRLFQEQHPGTVYTYDVSHRMATFLKQELSNDARWNNYLSQCGGCIPKFQQTNMAFLCPPKQRTKARFMQTHHQIRWGQNMLRYYDRGDFSLIDTHLSLNEALVETLYQQFGESEVKALDSQIGVNHPDQASLYQVLSEHLGDRVDQIPDLFWEQADTGKQRFLQGFEWLLDYRQDLVHYEQILEWSHFVQKQLKTEGLSSESQQKIEKSLNTMDFEDSRMQRLVQKTLVYLKEEIESFPDKQITLASSDIIESVFGTYKSYTEKGPLKEIGKLVLMIPVFIMGICKETLKKAMEMIPTSHIKKWLNENCGPSMLAKRCKAFNFSEGTETV